MTLPSTLEAEVYASLDASGDFDGEYDRLYRVKGDTGITLDEGRDGVQQLSPPKVGAGNFDLSDEQGVYSPHNAASPYYQRLLAGIPVLYVGYHGERRLYRSHVRYRDHLYYRGSALWQLGRHVLDDLDPSTDVGNRRVRISTLGYESVLTRAPVTIPLMTAPLVSECFTAYLDAVSWPADKRSIGTSDTRLLYYYADERVPWDGMIELLGAEGPGIFYVSRDGVFHFENRNFRTTNPRSMTSQATFYDRVAGQRTRYRAHVPYRGHRLYRGRLNGLTHTSLRPLNPYRNVFNRATYRSRRRQAASVATQIYDYGASLVLTAHQVQTLFVRPSDPFIDAISPQSGTDYTVAAGSATVTLTYTSGFLAIIRIEAGAGGATVNGVTSGGIQLRAKPLTVVSETTVENTVDASASIAKFSPIPGQNIPLTVPDRGGWPDIDVPNAQGVCDAWVLRQQRPRAQVTFTIQNVDGAHLEAMLRLRVSDRVTLVHRNSGLSVDVWVNSLQLRIADAGGRTINLVVGAEQCDDLAGALWDVSSWDDPFAVWGT